MNALAPHSISMLRGPWVLRWFLAGECALARLAVALDGGFLQSDTTAAPLTDAALADQFDSGSAEGVHDLGQAVYHSPDIALAGFHALDRRHRNAGHFRQRLLVD